MLHCVYYATCAKVLRPSVTFLILWLSACSTSGQPPLLLEPKPSAHEFPTPANRSFADYMSAYTRYIERARIPVQPAQAEQEARANAPFEQAPQTTCADNKKRGLLLSHGLNDSAYQMRSLAYFFTKNCFLVRVLTLDGHGTKPGDILKVDDENWFAQFAFGIASFADEVDLLYLGGFSTSANIATYFALNNDKIAGLALFSPAFMPDAYYPNTLRAISLFRDWLVTNPHIDYTKYLSFSVQSFLRYYNTVAKLQQAFDRKHSLNKPVFIAISDADSVVDVAHVRNQFDQNFVHPASTMHLYTKLPDDTQTQQLNKRVQGFQSFLPKERIVEISHFALASPAAEPHYGAKGDYIFCQTRVDEEYTNRCQQTAKELLWFGDWGVHTRASMPEETVFARLTYNPYFKEMAEAALHTLLATE